MSRATFLFRAAQLNILVLCEVLLGGFAFQFVSGELPCPLCMLQRHAMMLCALGPAFLIARARHGEMQYRTSPRDTA
jgi:disulfide bond formation protein DsbB